MNPAPVGWSERLRKERQREKVQLDGQVGPRSVRMRAGGGECVKTAHAPASVLWALARCASSAARTALANTSCSHPGSSSPTLTRTSELDTPYRAAQSSSP